MPAQRENQAILNPKEVEAMKKRFFIPACVLAAAAIGFVIYALGHPELSLSERGAINARCCKIVFPGQRRKPASCPHAPPRISHGGAIFHARRAFHKSRKGFISLKRNTLCLADKGCFSSVKERLNRAKTGVRTTKSTLFTLCFVSH